MRISELITIKENSFKYYDHDECIYAIAEDYRNLQYVAEQSNEICMFAIDVNPIAFRLVVDKNREISEYAVKADGLNIRYVPKQLHFMSGYAVRNNPDALKYLHKQPLAHCWMAIKKDPNAIRHVRIISPELIERAYSNKKLITKYISLEYLYSLLLDLSIPKKTREIIHLIYDIKKQTMNPLEDIKVIEEVFWSKNIGNKKGESLGRQYLLMAPYQTDEMIAHARKKYKDIFHMIHDKNDKHIKDFIRYGYGREVMPWVKFSYRYGEYYETYKVIYWILKLDSTLIEFFHKTTDIMKIIAYELNKDNLKYIHFKDND